MSRNFALALAFAAALSAGGCSSVSSLNPFAEKDVKLQGERRPVFQPGSGMEGPRRLPPPNSDYVGATMPAGQAVTTTPPPEPQGQASAPAPSAQR